MAREDPRERQWMAGWCYYGSGIGIITQPRGGFANRGRWACIARLYLNSDGQRGEWSPRAPEGLGPKPHSRRCGAPLLLPWYSSAPDARLAAQPRPSAAFHSFNTIVANGALRGRLLAKEGPLQQASGPPPPLERGNGPVPPPSAPRALMGSRRAPHKTTRSVSHLFNLSVYRLSTVLCLLLPPSLPVSPSHRPKESRSSHCTLTRVPGACWRIR